MGDLTIWKQFGKVDVNVFISKVNLILYEIRIPSNFALLLVEDLKIFSHCSVVHGSWTSDQFYLVPTKNNLKLCGEWLEFELWRSQMHLSSWLLHIQGNVLLMEQLDSVDDWLALHQQWSGECFIMSTMLVYDQIWCFWAHHQSSGSLNTKRGCWLLTIWECDSTVKSITCPPLTFGSLFCIQRRDGKLHVVHRLDAHLVIPDASNSFH